MHPQMGKRPYTRIPEGVCVCACLCVCVCTRVYVYVCVLVWYLWYCSHVWAPFWDAVIKLRSSALAGHSFTHWTILPSPSLSRTSIITFISGYMNQYLYGFLEIIKTIFRWFFWVDPFLYTQWPFTVLHLPSTGHQDKGLRCWANRWFFLHRNLKNLIPEVILMK